MTRLFEEAWGRGHLEVLEEIVGQGYRSHIDDVGAGRMVRWTGQAILRVELATYRSGLPDCHVELTAMVAEGDTVIARFTVGGTNTGQTVLEPFHAGARDLGIDPTGMAIQATGIAVFRIEDDRIAAADIIWELLGPLAQIRLFSSGSLAVGDLVVARAARAARLTRQTKSVLIAVLASSQRGGAASGGCACAP